MKRRVLILLAVIAIIAAASYLLRRHISLETIAAEETRLRDALAARPVASFLIGLLLYIGLSFIPPTAGKSLVFGWLFGFWAALVMVNVGLTVAAIGMFLISRHLLRDALRSKFSAYLVRLDRTFASDGAYYLFALRMMHAPYTFLNYAMGTTAFRTRPFWWTTQLGMLPGNALFVYAGTRLPTVKEAADQGLTGVATPGLIIALVAVGVFPLAIRWAVRRWWPRPTKDGA